MSQKVPISVLTGFLGAGKTSLIKHLLLEGKQRIAVIQNEFSNEMGMEKPVMRTREGELFNDLVEMPNGCLCCSVRDDIVSAVDYLILERGQVFDHILVEANGAADPGRLVEAFWVDEELGSAVYLDGILVVVDAQNLPSQLEGTPEVQDICRRQIACANLVILNKVDLVPQREALRGRVRQLNPDAPILEARHAAVGSNQVFGLEAFAGKAPLMPEVHSGHGEIDFLMYKTSELLDVRRLEVLLTELQDLSCGTIFRSKGLFMSPEGPMTLQCVGDTFELEALKAEDPITEGKLLFIGIHMKNTDLRARLDGCRTLK